MMTLARYLGILGCLSIGLAAGLQLAWAEPRIEPVDQAVQPVIAPTSPAFAGTDPILRSPVQDLDAGYLNYEPYNLFPRELDLWNLEGTRFVRSDGVIAPDKSAYAYSEVLFIPNVRQTISKVYLVPVPSPPQAPLERLPSEEVVAPPQPVDLKQYATRFQPEKSMQTRQVIFETGYDRVRPYDFRTLTIVDWSASGQRLLFKQRSGTLHVGLRTSDILIYNQGRGTVTIYPEVHRVIRHYWATHGNLPHLKDLAWDIQPLGWEPGSDSVILLKAWAYDKKEKKFLGLWQYNVDAERTQLLSLQEQPPPVAANGWLAKPVPAPVGKR